VFASIDAIARERPEYFRNASVAGRDVARRDHRRT
jgi:hypothetical protein